MSETIELALNSEPETEKVDFKEHIDVTSKGDWCEVIKDIVAMANSGGGVLLIGVNDEGEIANKDVTPVINYDPAKVTDKIFSYTGKHFSDFNIKPVFKSEYTIVAIEVRGVSIPLVFISPGNYQGLDGKPKLAFSVGTVYFRHGAKSEPCTSDDLQRFLNREIDNVKSSWLEGIRKVVEAPQGSTIMIVPTKPQDSYSGYSQAVRLTDDISAPINRRLDPNETHPDRQVDIIRKFNERLYGTRSINTHDFLCVKVVHNITNIPMFYYKPLYGSPRYSPEFLEWLIERYSETPTFFDECKVKYQEVTTAKGRIQG
ncbi:MAG: putative DNA binding domain-containing protein [Blastocatellia bacterium]|nr:putative DNA binding domain-containing protein [Blastocatellia bacterium]